MIKPKKIAKSNAIQPDQIIIIRHAQKATKTPRHHGVREDGSPDPQSLTVRGWQHAGALASALYILKKEAMPGVFITRPNIIFASGKGKKKVKVNGTKKIVGSKSKRPVQTISLMAAKLGLEPITKFTKGEEELLVKDVLRRKGTILICWQHDNIPAIGNLIAGDTATVPQNWPRDGYDLIWVFDRTEKGWNFRQHFHELLMPS